LTGPDPDVAYFFDSRSCPAKGGAGNNTMQYANPEVDRLLTEGAATTDQAKRKQAYDQVQAIIRNDLALLPIFQYARIEGTKGKLVGYKPSINVQANSWNVREWYWAT